ncbi:hypothetical protein [Alphaproteobacteria bacterium endosymbiont of Tiliacea citrago]|uniref:hypothetical protein n=1 Tax=Alphaproteobacteria bacterium endosymbiont of Tiliacea citrago TaxID=3077944 RepID=UPI00313BD393
MKKARITNRRNSTSGTYDDSKILENETFKSCNVFCNSLSNTLSNRWFDLLKESLPDSKGLPENEMRVVSNRSFDGSFSELEGKIKNVY